MRYMLLLLLLLNACSSILYKFGPSLVEIPLVEQQEVYLSKSKPAQHFGFQVFPPRGEVGLHGSARLHQTSAQWLCPQQIHS